MVDTLHPSPSVISSWPKPNYIDPPTQGPAVIYIIAICSIIGILVVSARLYARFYLTKAPGIDDAFIVFGLLVALVYGSLIIVGRVVYESGRHVWDIDPSTFVPHRLNVWICEWLYLVAAATVKISVLLFYRRLSVSFSRGFYVAVHIGIAYNVIIWFAFSVYLLAICQPVSAYWNSLSLTWQASHKYSCGDESISLPFSAAVNGLGDCYSAMLPMLMIKEAARTTRQKIALYSLFAIGFLSVGAAIARAALLYDIINKDYDFTKRLAAMWISSILELYLIIIAGSAPALKPFFRQFFSHKRSRSAREEDRSRGTSVSPTLGRQGRERDVTDSQINGDGTMRYPEKNGGIQVDVEVGKPTQSTTWYEIDMTSDDEAVESYEMQRTRLSDTSLERRHFPSEDMLKVLAESSIKRYTSPCGTPVIQQLSRQISNERHSI